jgi:broad specificity phosphatase PhoE
MKDKTRIFLVRHGESEHNVNKVFSGHANPELTAKGREQAALAREQLKDIKFDAVYSSTLKRAADTAEIITGEKLPEDKLVSDLKERNWGSLEGKPVSHAAEKEQERTSLPPEELWHFKHVPDMESDHEVSLRFVKALENLAKKHSGQTILVAGHGSAIRATITRLNGLGGRFSQTGSIKNADVVELGYVGGKLKALRLNGEKI